MATPAPGGALCITATARRTNSALEGRLDRSGSCQLMLEVRCAGVGAEDDDFWPEFGAGAFLRAGAASLCSMLNEKLKLDRNCMVCDGE